MHVVVFISYYEVIPEHFFDEYPVFVRHDVTDAPYWGEFGEFGACSVECGEGEQEAFRQCIYPSCWNGDPCLGSNVTTQICNIDGGNNADFVY